MLTLNRFTSSLLWPLRCGRSAATLADGTRRALVSPPAAGSTAEARSLDLQISGLQLQERPPEEIKPASRNPTQKQ